jgi:hypothetical protein
LTVGLQARNEVGKPASFLLSREIHMAAKTEFGLPIRPFFYTLDQLADMFVVSLADLRRKHIYFADVSTGAKPRDRILAHNISPDGERADWRVVEEELKRWLRYMGFRVYDRSTVRV